MTDEQKHSPLTLIGCYKTPLGIGVYTDPVKDLEAPEIICETFELGGLILRRVNEGPKVDKLLEIAEEMANMYLRIAESSHPDDCLHDLIAFEKKAREFLEAKEG